MKILLRGGSIAAGKGVSNSYFDIIKNDNVFSGFTFISCSNLKDTSFHGIWSFDEDINFHNPDILILHFGIDDIYLPVYRSEFKENLVQIIRLARKNSGNRIILLTSHPFSDSYDMNSANIYYRVIREVAVDLECELIPMHTFWAGYLIDNKLKLSDFLQDDERYPNSKGHELYARALKPVLERILNTRSN